MAGGTQEIQKSDQIELSGLFYELSNHVRKRIYCQNLSRMKKSQKQNFYTF